MRVLHLITGLQRGGAEHMLYKLLETDGFRGETAAVVSLTPGGVFAEKIAALGVPVEDLGMRAGPAALAGLGRLRKAIARHRPDVVHCWMYHAGVLAAVAARLGRLELPLIWNIRHSVQSLSDEKRTTRAVIRLAARLSQRPKRIVYNSYTAAEEHHALGYREAATEVIPNGFDLERLRPNPELRSATRRALEIADNQIAVLHLARFHPMKDHAGFLEAAARLAPDRRYVIVLAGSGVGAETPLFARLLAERFTAETRARVLLLGERDDAEALLNAADIVCVSSAYGEGFSNVLGEALSLGVPCVATKVGDAERIAGGAGLVVPPRSPEALAEALRALADEPAERRAARGRAARERMQREYSIPAVADRYRRLHAEVAAASGAAAGAATRAARPTR